jgi:8-oxo-dGTP pyrophosphatase MutT (NUDIX family)
MIRSAGIIIIDNELDDYDVKEPHALCLRAYADWDFPKGRVEEGESLVEAAIRETEEETTLTQEDYTLSGLRADSEVYGRGDKKKTATYFIADRTSVTEPFLPVTAELGKPEHDEWQWVPVSELFDLCRPRLQPVIEYVSTWCGNR